MDDPEDSLVRFNYAGVKTLQDMNTLYNMYDILFHPSPSEGAPRVIAEAAKAGMTTIGRESCEGIQEMVSSAKPHAPIGVLVDSPEAAADKILDLMNNPLVLKTLQDNARSWAESKFDPKHVVEEF